MRVPSIRPLPGERGARAGGPRPSGARQGGAAVAADHPAHGGERRRDPRQRRVADEADRRARPGRHRAHQRRCNERHGRPRRASQSAGARAREALAVLAGLLTCVALLLAASVAGVGLARRREATPAIYGAALVATLAALALALSALLAHEPMAKTLALPIGLPWLGAHFRLDALSAFFLAVINLGGAAASLYGLGYGRHEAAPERVLAFFPAFLAGMNLVLLADDAFTFLLSWESMSLASWALVMAHHRVPENARAGYIYLIMASFGTLCLLLAFALLAGPDGAYSFAAMRVNHLEPVFAALVLALVLLGAGSKAGLVPLH